ncbi:response regulator transcription factor [Niabella hibiscisoli]|uniref:response regulator transcription factor n=1 Tax=Niabella hibiscisoli TaxID=1825928 RepID=UPI001F0FF0F0|nr:response regulator [Niabella hibiscisoli]MCH5718759.1 response regulator [Niabella hibiscisoli]
MKTIAFVEDDLGILDVARFIFERAGYTIRLHHSAGSLLSQLHSNPDIFILDKQLPDMDGLDLCRRLKTNADTSAIPVLMLSANPQIKSLASAAGADAVMEKPFEIKDLLSVVSQLTSSRHN